MRHSSLLALVVLLLVGCTRTVVVQSPASTPSASPSPSPSRPPAYTPPPATHLVTYVVAGTAKSASTITYQNSTGDEEQASNVKLPWGFGPANFVVTEGDGTFLYVSAQNNGGGTILCSILWDGQLVKRGKATGLYAICTASGRA